MTDRVDEMTEKVAPEREEENKTCGAEKTEETEKMGEVEEEEIEESQEQEREQEDFKSKYFYLAAEMENMKKRFSRERENFLKYGNERILSALIDVVDNFDRTFEALERDKEEDEKISSIYTGIEMIQAQFLKVLKSNGLEQVEALGKDFDPNFHEAMGQQMVEGKRDQEVIQEYQKGYILNGRLLRAAKVIIAQTDVSENDKN